MSKGLETLEIVRKRLVDMCEFIQHKNPTAFIECDNNVEIYVNTNYIDSIEKELKALEVIKNKRVDTRYFYLYENVEDYNNVVSELNGDLPLTQKEYELIKEVLK